MKPGIVRELKVTVTEPMCPVFDGVLIHRCYSTWSIAHHFELAARSVLVDYLEASEEGIGSHVSIDHLAPCAVGRVVRICAELTEVHRERHVRAVCSMTAHDGARLLAKGKQVQVVMNKERLKIHLARS